MAERSKKKDKDEGDEISLVAENRKARFHYDILDKVEAGMKLHGDEVKSLRAHEVSIAEAFAKIEAGEVWLYGMHVKEYGPAANASHVPTRPRKLLLHHKEIAKLAGKLVLRGLTLVPLRIYFRRGWAKLELALAKGRTMGDKRHAIRDREEKRAVERFKHSHKSQRSPNDR